MKHYFNLGFEILRLVGFGVVIGASVTWVTMLEVVVVAATSSATTAVVAMATIVGGGATRIIVFQIFQR